MVCNLSGILNAGLVAVSFVVPWFDRVWSSFVVEGDHVFEAFRVSKVSGLVEVAVAVLSVEPGDVQHRSKP